MRGNLRSHRGHVNDRVTCMLPSSRAGHGTECSVTLFIVDKVYGLEGHCFTLDGVLPSTQSRRRKRDRREGLITGPSQTLLCARTTATASSSPGLCTRKWLKRKSRHSMAQKKRSPEFPARSLDSFGRRWGLSYRVCQGVQQDQKDTMSIMGYRMFSMESLAAWAVAGSSRIRPSLESRARLRPTRL
jgi:hypothetical protein